MEFREFSKLGSLGILKGKVAVTMDCGKMEAEDMIHAHENIKGTDADLFTKSQKVSMKANLWKNQTVCYSSLYPQH